MAIPFDVEDTKILLARCCELARENHKLTALSLASLKEHENFAVTLKLTREVITNAKLELSLLEELKGRFESIGDERLVDKTQSNIDQVNLAIKGSYTILQQLEDA